MNNPPYWLPVTQYDILCPNLWGEKRKYSVVVCDPPWYNEYYDAVLTQTSYSLVVGGYALLCLMPLHTRPTAVKDRDGIIKFASQVGLHIERLEPAAIAYSTPPFEIASLRKSGLDFHSNWRTGDIAIFRKVSDIPKSKLKIYREANLKNSHNDGEWDRILYGQKIIKIRKPLDDFGEEPEVLPIEPDNILSTVSRRYGGGGLANCV